MSIRPVGPEIPPSIAPILTEMRTAVLALLTPTQPRPVWAVASAGLPPAASWTNGVVRVSDLNILAVSDGTDWIRQDTGAVI